MAEDLKTCPHCESPYGYAVDNGLYICPECEHEWNPSDLIDKGPEVKDSNGVVLKNGDSVIVIKDLPVKGAPKPIKAVTKVKIYD